VKNIILIVLTIVLASCSRNNEADLTVIGNIKGLKKGTVYLKKFQDSIMTTLDSVSISGIPEFLFETNLEEPEVLYLVLDKNDTDEGTIRFFANKGTTEINTTLKNFAFDANIAGSREQALLQEHNDMVLKYNNKKLDIIKENFDALKDNDSIKAKETNLQQESLLKSKYLYTINFALNHKTSRVAPYLAITEILDARLKYLDTIYKSLPDSIATSKYGKELKNLIEKRSVSEDN